MFFLFLTVDGICYLNLLQFLKSIFLLVIEPDYKWMNLYSYFLFLFSFLCFFDGWLGLKWSFDSVWETIMCFLMACCMGNICPPMHVAVFPPPYTLSHECFHYALLSNGTWLTLQVCVGQCSDLYWEDQMLIRDYGFCK